MKYIHSIYTLLFGVAAVLFFGLAYPHHLHYQEQFQLFLFDSDYVWDVVRMPGGVADLLGRFCTQFFLYAWVGAIIIGIVLSAIQLLTLRLVHWGKLYGLSFVPSFLLWLFLLDENALFGSVWAVLLVLLATWAFDKLSEGWVRRILLIISIPMLYWMAGPVCIVFYLLQVCRSAESSSSNLRLSAFNLLPLALLLVMPLVLSHCLSVPAGKLWTGIHYHRYPTTFPTLLWAAALSIFLLSLLGLLLQRWQKTPNRPFVTLLSFVFVALCMGNFIRQNANMKAEKVMRYDFMACHQQWNRILDTISKEKPNNQIGVTVQNLALGMTGKLMDQLGQYNQNGLLGLLPDVDRDATSSLPTAEALYQLGMVNAAQRTVFEAQEAILDFQKSSRCYKRLAQTNLINGNYEVARKYLTALQKTFFYSDWANETLPLLGNEDAINKHPEYGHLRQVASTDDYYFSDHVTPEMLERLFVSNTDNALAYQYMMAAFMLTGDRDKFYKYAPTTP